MKLVATAAALVLSLPLGHGQAAPAHTIAPAAAPSSDTIPLDKPLPADTLVGKWWSEGREGLLKIVKTKSGRYEVLIDGKDKGERDVNNPDPKLRKRKLHGLVIMWNLTYEDGEYVDGYCYNPRDGNTYRVKMKMLSKDALRLRGYLGISLLGQNQDWTRDK